MTTPKSSPATPVADDTAPLGRRHSVATISRAAVLKEATRATHERLDQAIMAANPFANLQKYACFVKLQHAFHRDVSPLYEMPALQAAIPGLSSLSRFNAVARDADNLGIELPRYVNAPAAAGLALPEALGWLYVVEGSNLGAALLLKQALKMGMTATWGAEHLGEPTGGRAAGWRVFREALDAVVLAPEEEQLPIRSATEAFNRVRSLVAEIMY